MRSSTVHLVCQLWGEVLPSHVNVLCYKSHSSRKKAVVVAGLVGGDALWPVMSQVIASVPPSEQSMSWVTFVLEDALWFPPAALCVQCVNGG